MDSSRPRTIRWEPGGNKGESTLHPSRGSSQTGFGVPIVWKCGPLLSVGASPIATVLRFVGKSGEDGVYCEGAIYPSSLLNVSIFACLEISIATPQRYQPREYQGLCLLRLTGRRETREDDDDESS